MPSLYDASSPILAEVTRSGRVESVHRGALAVWHEGELLLSIGDSAQPVYCRSAVKPLQALPLLERGFFDRLGLTDQDLAVTCASHDGTAEHVAAVRAYQARARIPEEALGCGPHAPFDAESRRAMLRAGQDPLRVHNNCSGKHTGFLCLQRALGGALADYLQPDSEAQQAVATAVREMSSLDALEPEPLEIGTDGCGAPTFWLPLDALARAFARLANPVGLPDVRAAACRRILAVAGREPVLIAGPRRFCTALLRSHDAGAMFAKNGAEGVYVVALAPDAARRACPGGVGIAIKVSDGAERGYQPVAVDLLRHLGVWGSGNEVPEALQRFWRLPVRNTRKESVGEVRCAVEWQAS